MFDESSSIRLLVLGIAIAIALPWLLREQPPRVHPSASDTSSATTPISTPTATSVRD